MGPEAKIENYLRVRVNSVGGIAYKFTSPNRRSVPDRMCVMPTGEVIFVEVKAKNGKLTSGQEREIQRLRSLRQRVHVVYSKEEVDILVGIWE